MDFQSRTLKDANFTLLIGIGVPALAFICFCAYWFLGRDTWEQDNYRQIVSQCDAVHQAVARGDESGATMAYAELTAFVGNRRIVREDIAERIASADTAQAPLATRLKAKQEEERQELLAKQRQEEAARRKAEQAKSSPSTPAERYYRDNNGELIAESEFESRIQALRVQLQVIDDPNKKAFMEGFLRGLEQEWERIKRQGPVDVR